MRPRPSTISCRRRARPVGRPASDRRRCGRADERAQLDLVVRADHQRGGVALRVARDALLRREDRVLAPRPATNCARTYMPGSSRPSGLGKRARSVTEPVLGIDDRLGELQHARRAGSRCRPRARGARRRRRRATPPPASCRRSASRSTLDCWMSTKIGSSRWMVVSGSAWPPITSAPVVTSERPMRPEIGALTSGESQVDARRCRARARARPQRAARHRRRPARPADPAC